MSRYWFDARPELAINLQVVQALGFAIFVTAFAGVGDIIE
jgi:hypothetical protein